MPACPGQVGHRRACHDFRQCGLPSGGGYPTRRLDGRVRRLSNAADYSGLWLGMAAAIAVLGTRLGYSGPCSACFDPGIPGPPLQAIPHRRSRSRTPLVGTCPDWPSRSGCSPAEWPTRECIPGCTTRATSRSARSSEPARRSWWQQSSTRFGASSCGSSRSTGALLAAHRAGWGGSLIPTLGRGRHPSPASGAFVCSTHASAPGNTMVS